MKKGVKGGLIALGIFIIYILFKFDFEIRTASDVHYTFIFIGLALIPIFIFGATIGLIIDTKKWKKSSVFKKFSIIASYIYIAIFVWALIFIKAINKSYGCPGIVEAVTCTFEGILFL